jgi:transcriptional regulator with GAF, ATPase, and Fis domain
MTSSGEQKITLRQQQDKGINSETSDKICRSLNRILGQGKRLDILFHELSNRLNDFFALTRSTLTVMDNSDGKLRIIALWDNTLIRQGLILTLPQENSLLYKAYNSGKKVVMPFFNRLNANIIEKKLLVGKTSSSLIICPLIKSDYVLGLISMSSEVPYAFDLITDGHFTPVLNKLARVIYNKYGCEEELEKPSAEGINSISVAS